MKIKILAVTLFFLSVVSCANKTTNEVVNREPQQVTVNVGKYKDTFEYSENAQILTLKGIQTGYYDAKPACDLARLIHATKNQAVPEVFRDSVMSRKLHKSPDLSKNINSAIDFVDLEYKSNNRTIFIKGLSCKVEIPLSKNELSVVKAQESDAVLIKGESAKKIFNIYRKLVRSKKLTKNINPYPDTKSSYTIANGESKAADNSICAEYHLNNGTNEHTCWFKILD